jgi:diguanylate cyclase (GGDEF)-like protein
MHSTAILITSDSESLHWAPRWLKIAGLDVRVFKSAKEAFVGVASKRPDLIIAEANMFADGCILSPDALHDMRISDMPRIALCKSGETLGALDVSGVTDLARSPYDWQLISRRAANIVSTQNQLADLRDTRRQLQCMHEDAEATKRSQDKVVDLDKLTELPNAERFRRLLHRAVAARVGSKRSLGLLVVGLDRYRMVNEAVGYQNANQLLKQFSKRFRACLSNRDLIRSADRGTVTAVAARLGGAKFALLISDADMDEVIRFRHSIQDSLARSFEVDGQSIYLNVSIGAAIFPDDCTEADSLLHFAESAMLEAQESGSGFQFHTEPGDIAGARYLNLDRMLREAIRNNDLKLAYQAITDTASGRTVGAEALLRWNHSTEGMISPEDFVPVAEKTGLMQEIGDFVIASACAQLRCWIDAGLPPIRMAVNLSLCQLVRGDVASVVRKALRDNRIDAKYLEIELSERGVLNRRPEVVSGILSLKACGVRISIDDFGTGDASIAYLKDLPVDVIKIDRSYISGAALTSREEAIAAGMIALANHLQTTVVAEGVETKAQLDRLRGWGAGECQGFYFSEALPANEFFAKNRNNCLEHRNAR